MGRKSQKDIKQGKNDKPENTSKSTYAWAEVGKHCLQNDVWVVIDESVYDVSKFVNQHPGGSSILLKNAGRNASNAFKNAGHSDRARKQVLPEWRIGAIEDLSTIEPWQRCDSSITKDITMASIFLALILASFAILIL